MKLLRSLPILCVLSCSLLAGARAQTSVTMWQYDTQHTGNNPNETALTPALVGAAGNFGYLYSQPTDGQTYGQPVLASGISVNGTTHDIVYVATEAGTIFAYDADGNAGTNASAIWSKSLLPSGTVPMQSANSGSGDIDGPLAITTTPVIDLTTSAIYIAVKFQNSADSTYHQYLYALDLATGNNLASSPVEINPAIPGNSSPDSSNGVITFNAMHMHLRCAMAIYNGVIYLAYASHSDTPPYHGDVIGYDATSLQLVKSFTTSPSGTNPKGGLWMSGAGPAFDASGNLYVSVANQAADTQVTTAYGTGWGESMLKISTSGALSVAHTDTTTWFTPYNYVSLDGGDADVGSGGLLVLPDQGGPIPHLLLGGGKAGTMYLLNRDNMGGVTTKAPNNSVQEYTLSYNNTIPSMFTTPAYFNGYVYYAAAGAPLEQRAVGYDSTYGYISPNPVLSTNVYNNKGSGCFITSNGTQNGIVWILNGSGADAYDAKSVAGSPIYTASSTVPASGGTASIGTQNTKFSLPIVANGKLYFTGYHGTTTNGTTTYSGYLFVYGQLAGAAGAPAMPTNVYTIPATSTSNTIYWTNPANNDATGFYVYRATTRNGPYTKVGTTSTATSYVDSGLKPSTTYYYEIQAYNNVGPSSFTSPVTATTFPTYVENGLVAYWSLDETSSSTVADSTGKGHTGTFVGEHDQLAALINYGVRLHGTGQSASYINVADAADLEFAATDSFTIALWVNPLTLRSAEQAILTKSLNTGSYYGLYLDANGHFVFRGPGADVTSTATAAANTWVHVALVQDGTNNTRTIYLNGVPSGTPGVAQAGNGTGALWMGNQNVNGNIEGFPGELDEVRVYRRALAAAEVPHLMGPPVLQAMSGQTQGTAGAFNYLLWPSLAKTVEPRRGATAGTYNLALSFSAPVSGISASLLKQSGGTATGTVGSLSYDATGETLTVPLTGVANAQDMYLHLTGISPGGGTADVPFSVLVGDINADNLVNRIDVRTVLKNHTSGTATVDASHAFYDLNCDGIIDASDDALANAAAGTSLGAQADTNLAFYGDSTESSDNGTGVASQYAFDNNITTTRWESIQGVDPQYIYVDLGEVCTVHGITLDWENAAGKNYTLDVCTDSTITSSTVWNNIKTVTGNTTTGVIPYTGFNVPARFVRMYGTVRTGIYGYSLYDFDVIGQSAASNLPAVPTVNSPTTATATTGTAFSYTITATNSPTGYGASGLPSTLSVNTTTGVISGTPTAAGSYNVTLSATNGGGTGTGSLTLTVQTPYAAFGRARTSPRRSRPTRPSAARRRPRRATGSPT